MDQRVKFRMGNRKVIEMKQRFLEMKMRRGEVKVGVLVRGCTECNTHHLWNSESTWPGGACL